MVGFNQAKLYQNWKLATMSETFSSNAPLRAHKNAVIGI